MEGGGYVEPQAQSAVEKSAQGSEKSKGKVAPRSERTQTTAHPGLHRSQKGILNNDWI